MKDIGTRVSAIRRERKISTSALAQAIGVSSTAISKLESGDTAMPRADHLLRIAAELGTNPVRLVFGEDSEEYRRINDAWPDTNADRGRAMQVKYRRLLARIHLAFLEEFGE
ncbi:helix-turn-helix transcriptional regulator [Paraburkholderia sp. 31.1]|uniref:helix-turn-helix domain-containing protein n=1 Tax=Paraburkholderia sp. 31.1 TaxID=2615205 RepID=UPI001655FD6D|nr:helix-turn-helix transcriptional regulator [Paraburkholderia sp. 31.1]MBC8721231.1 helix-turn-helix transcriptional regulator [Paraburkholderia sp. 31.1]